MMESFALPAGHTVTAKGGGKNKKLPGGREWQPMDWPAPEWEGAGKG